MAAVDPGQRAEAVVDRRFTALVQAETDLAAIRTWDEWMYRRTRILVPADVQAFVVPAAGGEATVPVTGGTGDPPPFAAASARPAGVHLHWAMPDALLAGGHDTASNSLKLPPLPDRWVVIRALQPVGERQARLRGWVLDATSRSVTPLPGYTGTPDPGPGPRLDPLDGAAGGSLLWTASYTASEGRFGFHDTLDDVAATDRFEGGQAGYTVAGWWSDLAGDPLAAAVGPHKLDAALAALGWHVVHDADDYVLIEPDPRIARVRDRMGLRSPKESPPAKVTGADGRTISGALDDVVFDMEVPVAEAAQVIMTPALPRYATLVHGSVLGVPVMGSLTGPDDRPATGSLGLALGQDLDDVVAAFGAVALRLDPEHRRSAETLVAAFTSGLIEQIGNADGLEDLAEREHGDGFWSLPGTPLAAARPDRLRSEDSAPVGPLTVGRKGRAATPDEEVLEATLEWKGKTIGLATSTSTGRTKGRSARASEARVARKVADAREVVRPAPRFFRPQPPMLAIRGARPNHRHHGDGLFDDSGKLRCRYPRECAVKLEGVIAGSVVVPSLGSGAVPDEVLSLVRESVLLNPYGYRWLAAAAAPTTATAKEYVTRIAAEMVRLYGTDGRYDGSSHLPMTQPKAAGSWRQNTRQASIWEKQVAQALAEHSLLAGTPPSPVAITTWRQPWVPLWLEWRVVLDGTDSVAGWELDGIDLNPPAIPQGTPVSRTFAGRSPLGAGAATALRESIRRWVDAELQRDATGSSTLPTSDQNALAQLGDLIAPYDLMSASLDGVREQLLGIPYVGVIDRGTGADPKPTATGEAVPLFGGTLKLAALRIVDAFGRVLDVPAAAVATTATTLDLQVAGLSGGIRLRPRVQHLARWLFRMVDASQPAATDPVQLREAFVDQLDPEGAASPVAGFLLPDHIDEELEAFTPAGTPIGQIGHDAVTGAVTWEPAPGRAVPPDAGPLTDLDAQARITGEIAAGLVQADAAARNAASTPASSALSALLRAIDTTLWTVDTFAAVGSPTVAGLVGRPVAVVRAFLRLDAPDDLDEVEVTAASGVAGRRAAFEALREQRFPVKLGALTRTDDSLLGFYVDDDYAHLHLVDRVIAAQAIDSGRQRGQLGLLGKVTTPPVNPLSHPYLVPDGTLWLRAGQTVRLTLLMLPLGRVHLTSGVLPRKELALSDEWVGPGLKRLVPSVRVGPVLVDPAEIRLPLVTLLGDKQTFTRRTGPLTWRDDPIVAATQSALLPKLPHEAQEGWVRVTPAPPAGDAEGGTP
ncbi:MAG TPA: hypothetical protein VFR67_28510 [Pilimelia sp.]|nr:hypothetical protein [Pilimelia sp.]